MKSTFILRFFLFFHKMPVIFLKQPHGHSLYCEKEFVKTINYVPFTSPALVSLDEIDTVTLVKK